MARFTKALRQQIVREFAVRHNGYFNPSLFLEEVRANGPDHPAHEWFQWDDDKAAREHRLWQAREFAKDLKVTFEVEEVGRNKAIKITEQEAPMVISPGSGRNSGGGYFLTDPDNPEHMAEHCRQAAVALRSWLRRYESAVKYAGGSVAALERSAAALEKASAVDEAA